MHAIQRELGTISRSSSSRFRVNSAEPTTPVTLPPGWARLATRPVRPGHDGEDDGIVAVAALAAAIAGVASVTSTSTLRRTKSAASRRERSM